MEHEDFDLTKAFVTWTGGTAQACTNTWPSQTTSNYCYAYSYPVYVDKGEKAFKLLQALRTKKFVKLTTIDEFIDAMNILMKEL